MLTGRVSETIAAATSFDQTFPALTRTRPEERSALSWICAI